MSISRVFKNIQTILMVKAKFCFAYKHPLYLAGTQINIFILTGVRHRKALKQKPCSSRQNDY